MSPLQLLSNCHNRSRPTFSQKRRKRSRPRWRASSRRPRPASRNPPRASSGGRPTAPRSAPNKREATSPCCTSPLLVVLGHSSLNERGPLSVPDAQFSKFFSLIDKSRVLLRVATKKTHKARYITRPTFSTDHRVGLVRALIRARKRRNGSLVATYTHIV